MSRYSLVCAGFVAVALVAPHAQTPARPAPVMMSSVDPALFKGMQYRLVGPSRGGRVTTVTGVPSQPRTFYMGVASGGLFRTTDSGTTWTPITDGKVPRRIDGCRGGGRVRSQRDLSRHRIGRRAQQRVDRARDVQDDRRRRDVEVHGSLRHRADRRRAHPSDQSEHRVGRRAGRHVQGEQRARHLQDDRRRRDVEESALRLRHDWRDGRRPAAWPPGRRLCLDVTARAQAVDDHQRRPGRGRRGLLQVAPTAASTSRRSSAGCRTSSSAKPISR